jgi:hypothetical protein
MPPVRMRVAAKSASRVAMSARTSPVSDGAEQGCGVFSAAATDSAFVVKRRWKVALLTPTARATASRSCG